MTMDRRRFLQVVGVGSAAYAFGRTRGAAFAQVVGGDAPFSDYKALVCLFLFGGNDSWNMVVPSSDAEYDTYAASRQNLAIAKDSLVPISPISSSGRSYGFHPAMPELAGLFEQEKAAVVANVGPLLAPTTLDAYRSRALVLPPQLFSHNDQQSQWHALHGRGASKSGWAGRMAEVLVARLPSQALAVNTSLFGQTLFQTSSSQSAYTIGAGGPVKFTGFGPTGLNQARQSAFAKLLNPTPPYPTIYERAFAATQARAMASAETITAALASAPMLTTAFPQDSALATQLSTVAKLIAVRDQLKMKRQVFFVAAGGFDTHDDQNDNQPVLLGDVSRALDAFYRATVELGVADRVTTFTQSDFGRTLTSNGDGTDHAWGGVQLVLGGAVAGRKIVGQYPVLRIGARLATEGADDVGGGRFIPTLSSDQYAATLAKWFGVASGDFARVAPSIGNFQEKDLGLFL